MNCFALFGPAEGWKQQAAELQTLLSATRVRVLPHQLPSLTCCPSPGIRLAKVEIVFIFSKFFAGSS